MHVGDALGLVDATLAWLQGPISDSNNHHVSVGIAWHGRLMVVAWIVLAPLSILIARFYKVTTKQDWPRELDNPFWFVTHRRLGYAVGVLMTIALGLVWWSHGFMFHGASLHALGGWALLLLGAAQIAGSTLRGTHGGPVHPFTRKPVPPEHWHGDHYSMTRRRIVFEYMHKALGYALMPLIGTATLSGLWVVDAPRWMWIAAFGICLGFVCAFLRLQRQDRCIDTYQAIWGVDPTLPGNRRPKAIGWGIKRYGAEDIERRSRLKR